MAHICTPSILEMETEGSQVQGPLRPVSYVPPWATEKKIQQ